jgi:hypothetical protein
MKLNFFILIIRKRYSPNGGKTSISLYTTDDDVQENKISK